MNTTTQGKITPGTPVVATDALGNEWSMTADSEIEPGNSFPIVWVQPEGTTDRIAWPAEFVAPA